MPYKSGILLILLHMLLFSCGFQEEKTIINTTTKNNSEKKTLQDSIRIAAQWLTNAIETHFNEGKDDMTKICTATYAEYKSDATNVGLDPGMPEADFKKKWEATFDIKYAGLGVGFLIAGQDNGKIKVSKCEFKNRTPDGGFLFATLLDDTEMNAGYKRDIKVLPSESGFLIGDVLEYE